MAALTIVVALVTTTVAAPPAARADTPACALTNLQPTATTPTPGNPCWTDVTPYPFGADGNPVNPSSGECGKLNPPGSTYSGDFTQLCYLTVTSISFRAWNRGLAATQLSNGGGTPYGVWLYNGTRWYPDPTFPGSSACPGSLVGWAGKLDYWLTGSQTAPQQTLCRFDGVNFQWEELTVPASTLARWAANPMVNQGITSGACYAWNNCWFFGTEGTVLHWDGLSLTDASTPLGNSPWLDAAFTAAVARTGAGGNEFGFAVTGTGQGDTNALADAVPAAPDGSPPPQLYQSLGGPFEPTTFSPPDVPQPGDPFTTDLKAVDLNAAGAGWIAGDPSPREFTTTPRPAPLLNLTANGSPGNCPDYGPSTFTYGPYAPDPNGSFIWKSLSVFPNDGTALAAAQVRPASPGDEANTSGEPAVVHAACGQAPTITEFRMPDPTAPDQSTAPLIAEPFASTLAVAAIAANDGWATTTTGVLPSGQSLRPHLYQWTDGQPPNAPAGDDVEARPSAFTLGPATYVQPPPQVVQLPGTQTTQTQQSAGKRIKLPPSVYDVKVKRPVAKGTNVLLIVTFKVRRRVTIGLNALRGHAVVARSGVKTFAGRSGKLTLVLSRRRWPTSLRFVTPKQTSPSPVLDTAKFVRVGNHP